MFARSGKLSELHCREAIRKIKCILVYAGMGVEQLDDIQSTKATYAIKLLTQVHLQLASTNICYSTSQIWTQKLQTSAVG